MNKEYDDKKLSLFINNCINIENNIKEINIIKEKVEKCNSFENIKINFVEQNEQKIKEIIDFIKNFGNLEMKHDFKEIQNPWTNQKFRNLFYYTLKDNSYTAEKTEHNGYIHLIKSSYEFKKDKIYKLEFIPNYIKDNDFQIGFADFNQSKGREWFKDNYNCVGLTNEGLYINGTNINSNLIIKNGIKIEFIIDISKKSFILNINGKNEGEFKFNFQNNIFAHAAIRNIGNSVTIKTFEK